MIRRQIRQHFSTTEKMQKKILAANDCRMIFFVKLESRKILGATDWGGRQIGGGDGSSGDGSGGGGSGGATDPAATDCRIHKSDGCGGDRSGGDGCGGDKLP
jgi:hypothetical protein